MRCPSAPRTELGARWGRTTAETVRRTDELIEARRVAVVAITATVDTLTVDLVAGRDPLVAAVVAGRRLVDIGRLS